MPPPHPPPLMFVDWIGPVVAAGVFVVLMGLVREPARRTVNAIIVAGATGAYLSGGGFGVWEVLFPIVALPFAYAGLRTYRAIAAAWLLHAGWDFAHHLWGRSIWPFLPTSSFGCLIFDSLIAVWFLLRARSIWLRQGALSPRFSRE